MRILITSGGTRVDIDPVRYIMNMSKGTMGSSIATEALVSGHEVHFLTSVDGKTPFKLELDYNELRPGMSSELINRVEALHDDHGDSYLEFTYKTYEDYRTKMYALPKCFDYDAIVMCAAVSDYTTERKDEKAKSSSEMSIQLEPTEKIIDNMRSVAPDAFLVGFKLLNDVSRDQLTATCENYLVKKNLDMMVGNDLASLRCGEYYQIHTTKHGSEYVDFNFAEFIVKAIEICES